MPVALGLDMFVTDVVQPPRALLTPGVPSFMYGLPASVRVLWWLPPAALVAGLVTTWRAGSRWS